MSKSFLSIVKPSAFRTLLQSSTTPTASSSAAGTSTPLQPPQPQQHRTIPIDATWFMPNSGRNAHAEYEAERIPHARFFDLDKYSRDSPYPHMLPTQQIMTQAFRELGIRPGDNLVVYDKVGNFSSPRAAFTLRLFGHDRVYLLDNYVNYKNYDYPLDLNKPNFEHLENKNDGRDGEAAPVAEVDHGEMSAEQFQENYDREVIEYEELENLVDEGEIDQYLVLDARSRERFTGETCEPRPGLSSGHVPTAKNLPFTKFLDAEQNNQFKTRDRIEAEVKECVGVAELAELKSLYPRGIIVMCGTGVTACILKLGLENVLKVRELGVNVRLYDGSWTEWAMRAPDKFIIKDV
ncbi:uncharacterized protein LODBEIA_P34200 [Lodderomyces beijingensis]|uniref:Sulfurtransferase n=1 Tax=Lodderomyces beijingensis TaxID=1775926 RepID=A0ABP0ZQI6_9ASCO